MAKLSSINTNAMRLAKSKKFKNRRDKMKKVIMNQSISFEERMEMTFKLSELPRNSAPIRVRNRCLISGRPRGYHRRFGMSRIALRELGNFGLIPGLMKASW
jgi:small subunit ribosomal protein S14